MINKKYLGDAHNFNRRVSYFETAGLSFIEKPRCIFWEYLFLDQRSPLRTFLRNLDAHVNFDQILGHIGISSQDLFKTGVADFITETPISDLDAWLLGYGELLGFVTAFGITDLHRENILNIDNRPRLVDIECLFWAAEIPSETFLLSKNAFEWSKSIFTATGLVGLKTLTSEQVSLVLQGYVRVLDYIKYYAEDIKDFFTSLRFESYPIRILIERTRDYRGAMDSLVAHAHLFADEELLQMRRGDIPYFFGYVGGTDIHYYSSETAVVLLKSRRAIIEEKLKKSFKNPSDLLSIARIERIQKQGVAEVTVRLLNPDLLPSEGPESNFFLENGFLKISYKDIALQVKYQESDRG